MAFEWVVGWEFLAWFLAPFNHLSLLWFLRARSLLVIVLVPLVLETVVILIKMSYSLSTRMDVVEIRMLVIA